MKNKLFLAGMFSGVVGILGGAMNHKRFCTVLLMALAIGVSAEAQNQQIGFRRCEGGYIDSSGNEVEITSNDILSASWVYDDSDGEGTLAILYRNRISVRARFRETQIQRKRRGGDIQIVALDTEFAVFVDGKWKTLYEEYYAEIDHIPGQVTMFTIKKSRNTDDTNAIMVVGGMP